MSNSNKFAWFLAGAALGATAALLYAPQSGEETRRYIGKQARRGRRRVMTVSRDLYERGREMAEDAAEAVEEGIDRARRSFQG
jgi:gas vesicle protein